MPEAKLYGFASNAVVFPSAVVCGIRNLSEKRHRGKIVKKKHNIALGRKKSRLRRPVRPLFFNPE